MIVVDTNVVAYLLIGGEKTPVVRDVVSRDAEWAAPILWRSEFRNVVATYLRRGELALSDAVALVAEAEALLRGREFLVTSDSVLDLAADTSCSAYDCEFVALARQLGVPFVTSDRRLLDAFPSDAVSADDFASRA
ncbi:MAG: type II toxin-antitoxin system VapC family toxin [Coriobacteriales bacterium]|nr:type II toxin-antitoxin system VapC family toxin [Coriobacteriales bacterium]